ncbi:DcaP family trimeric outer membrane transporter [Phorcysia thermohydrogeniphila]|uniref:Porin-like protein n=1 Tax=Phorcysia thermohydrogeniphila TaxID=936138 RepID=A0A4R1GC74_9BACT|nr:DcaP family trimeric outer membrane transporter [Phorcysia thermohydrogeniphila]TCK05438.1 hypothetical protein CLV27_0866 [Phorcysia thermohydrogeniphila]
MRRALLLGTAFILSSSLPALAVTDYEVEQLRQMIEQMRIELQQVKEENRRLKEEIRLLKGGATAKGAPSFKSKSGKSVDFYGFFKIDAAYSDSKAVGKDYILFVLPETSSSNDDDFNLNFKHSRFGFLIKTEEGDYKIVGNLEFDFYGDLSGSNDPNKEGIRVRKAWVQFGKEDWNIRAGMDWMLLTQLYPHLSNFPSGALMGNIGYRIPQIRFTKLFKTESGKFTTQVALDKVWGDPWNDPLKPYIDTGSDSGTPDVQGRFVYDFDLEGVKLHLGVIGHYGKMQIDLAGGDKYLDTYSYGFEGAISPAGWLTISGKIWAGRNLAGWYTGGIGQGVLYVDSQGLYTKLADVKDDKPTDAREIDAKGGWIEVTLKPTSQWLFHVGYGVDDPDNDDFKYGSDVYKKARTKNTMYYANGLYKLTPSLGFMMEYLRVKTDYDFISADGTVNRFQGSVLYFF